MGRACMLVGRSAERAEVLADLAGVRDGHSTLHALVGPPGIGKSCLAEAIAADAERSGLRVCWGRCWEGEAAPPLWPWRQALRAIGRELPVVGDGGDAEHARFVLFEAVAATLADAAPLVLVFDDLHAADPASLLLLRFATRYVRGLGVLATWREAESRTTGEVRALLQELRREGTTVPLRSLSPTEVGEVAEGRGLRLPPDVVAEVARQTEGLPLYVDQALRQVPPQGQWIPFVPAGSLREMLLARFARLDGDTRGLLETVAVVGREAAPAVVARAVGWSAPEMVAALQRAFDAGLLEEGPRGDLRFTHVLLRDELHASIPRDRREALHARVAEALVACHAVDPPLDAIAHHALEGVGVLGAARAAEACIRAAEGHEAVLAFQEAAALLARALQALESMAAPEVLVDVLLARGSALLRAGAYQAAKDACDRAAELARSRGDAARLARAALTRGAEFTPALVDPTLVALLREALAALPGHERALRARTLARLAAALQPARDPAGPVAMAREALALAEGMGPDDRQAVLFAVSSALADREDVRERIAIDEELLDLARVAGDRVQTLRVHARLVFDHMEAGEVARADEHLAAHGAIAAPFREGRYRWPPLLMQAMRALFAGRLDEVDRLHDQARAVAGEVTPNLAIVLMTQRYFRLLEDERYDEALEALRAVPTEGPGRYVGHVLAARVAARRGDLARARAELAAAREFGLPMTDPVSANLLAEALAAAGDRADIEAVYEAFLPRARGLVSFGMTAMAVDGPVSRLLGHLAAALGREDAARRHFDDALAQLAALDASRWTARTRREAERAFGRVVTPEHHAAPQFAIEARGSHYEVQHGRARATVRDAVGMRLLARIVHEPGREFHVLTLVSEDGEIRSSDAGPMLDSRAIAAYRERAATLREELEEAESFGDIARAWQRRAELEQLGDELSRGVGLGGRERRAASASERARINVQRHLKKAIAAIAAQLPELGKHLERSVRTGTCCRYEP